jgi:hypothetical protein
MSRASGEEPLKPEWVAAMAAAVATFEAEQSGKGGPVVVSGIRQIWPRPSPWRWRPR